MLVAFPRVVALFDLVRKRKGIPPKPLHVACLIMFVADGGRFWNKRYYKVTKPKLQPTRMFSELLRKPAGQIICHGQQFRKHE
jgi:hypothetical protein